MPRERFYTTKGDDGTTGLFGGGRVRKDDLAPEAYGAVDEAQAVIGVARAAAESGSDLDAILVAVERDLWVLMAELATAPENRSKLRAGQFVTDDMVDRIETLTDEVSTRFEIPAGGFAVPGQDPLSAHLDVARTVVRRAERRAIPVAVDGSHVIPYLNRLSSLLWALARAQEEDTLPTKES